MPSREATVPAVCSLARGTVMGTTYLRDCAELFERAVLLPLTSPSHRPASANSLDLPRSNSHLIPGELNSTRGVHDAQLAVCGRMYTI